MDVITAQAVRAGLLYYSGRFLDGWAEMSGAAGMAWAAGLGKLGGVSENLAKLLRGDGHDSGSGDHKERERQYEKRVQLEERVRLYRYKGAVLPPPADAKEYGQRVELL